VTISGDKWFLIAFLSSIKHPASGIQYPRLPAPEAQLMAGRQHPASSIQYLFPFHLFILSKAEGRTSALWFLPPSVFYLFLTVLSLQPKPL